MKFTHPGTDNLGSILRRFNDLDDDHMAIEWKAPVCIPKVFRAHADHTRKCPELGFNHESQKVEIGVIALLSGVSLRR